MAREDVGGELRRALRERDLYRRLLDLGAQTEIEPFLAQALALIVEVTGARQGYLELTDAGDEDGPWSIASGFSEGELADVRSRISRGIIAEAIASGGVVETPSAMADARFSARESVQGRRIEAVLCAPIGSDPPAGALYLQGRERSGPFGPEDRDCAVAFARHLAPLADTILLRHRSLDRVDPTLPHRRKLALPGLVGRSHALAALLHEVGLVAPLDVSVLLTGESGTGKSLIARLIHDNGPRARHPFVELNCAAFQDTLLESEFFGALPGSHSTATRPIQGKVAAAEKGTLFLDEVSELSPSAQAKLLQLLQAKTYYPLGASTPVRADVRIIAATNADLDEAVAARRFREDLLYRLRVLPLRVPSLAERRDDVVELACHFCDEACVRHGLPRLELSIGARRALEAADWPGNARQLANAVEAAVIRAAGEGSQRVERSHVFPDAGREEAPDAAAGFQEATRRFQRQLLEAALEANDWNVAATAKQLDLSRSHFYNLVNAFGLRRRSED
jgi:Nif-specific regulatory protein